VNGEIVSNMVKVPIYSQMVILSLGPISKENQTGMVSISGNLVLFTSVNLKKVSSMAKGNGKNNKIHSHLAISTMESMQMIERTVTVSFLGRAEIFIGVIIKMMRDMGMVRCSGPTVLFTKENGKWAFSTDMER